MHKPKMLLIGCGNFWDGYKHQLNWPNDACVGGFHSTNKDEYVDDLPSMEKFMKMKKKCNG